MEQLTEFLNRTVEIGGINLTYMVLAEIIGVVLVIFILVKSTMKAIFKLLLAALIVISLISLDVVTPEQVIEVGSKVKDVSINTYEEMAKTTDSIKLINNEVNIKLEDNYERTKDIQSVEIKDNVATVYLRSGIVKTTDNKAVVKLLRIMFVTGEDNK